MGMVHVWLFTKLYTMQWSISCLYFMEVEGITIDIGFHFQTQRVIDQVDKAFYAPLLSKW